MTDTHTYEIEVESNEAGALDASDLVAHICSEIQDLEDVESVVMETDAPTAFEKADPPTENISKTDQ